MYIDYLSSSLPVSEIYSSDVHACSELLLLVVSFTTTSLPVSEIKKKWCSCRFRPCIINVSGVGAKLISRMRNGMEWNVE